MANESAIRELKQKVESLVAARFSGDFRTAFRYFDINQDGKIDRAELMDLLKEAGIGNWLTRGKWADGIVAALDKDGDGAISLADLQGAVVEHG